MSSQVAVSGAGISSATKCIISEGEYERSATSSSEESGSASEAEGSRRCASASDSDSSHQARRMRRPARPGSSSEEDNCPRNSVSAEIMRRAVLAELHHNKQIVWGLDGTPASVEDSELVRSCQALNERYALGVEITEESLPRITLDSLPAITPTASRTLANWGSCTMDSLPECRTHEELPDLFPDPCPMSSLPEEEMSSWATGFLTDGVANDLSAKGVLNLEDLQTPSWTSGCATDDVPELLKLKECQSWSSGVWSDDMAELMRLKDEIAKSKSTSNSVASSGSRLDASQQTREAAGSADGDGACYQSEQRGEEDLASAKQAWLERREKKKAAKSAKRTYGVLLREQHEQTGSLPTSLAASVCTSVSQSPYPGMEMHARTMDVLPRMDGLCGMSRASSMASLEPLQDGQSTPGSTIGMWNHEMPVAEPPAAWPLPTPWPKHAQAHAQAQSSGAAGSSMAEPFANDVQVRTLDSLPCMSVYSGKSAWDSSDEDEQSPINAILRRRLQQHKSNRARRRTRRVQTVDTLPDISFGSGSSEESEMDKRQVQTMDALPVFVENDEDEDEEVEKCLSDIEVSRVSSRASRRSYGGRPKRADVALRRRRSVQWEDAATTQAPPSMPTSEGEPGMSARSMLSTCESVGSDGRAGGSGGSDVSALSAGHSREKKLEHLKQAWLERRAQKREKRNSPEAVYTYGSWFRQRREQATAAPRPRSV